MRNQFRKTKKVNCAILFSLNKLSLQIIYANEVNIYYLQRCMNWLNIINTAPPTTTYERRWDMSLKTINFGRGGFYIRPLATHKIMAIFRTHFPLHRNVISAMVEYFYRCFFFGCDLSVVSLCENFAHLRSLVFTFISHSCSY